MKKVVRLWLALCMLLCMTQVTFAATPKEIIEEGVDLNAVHRLALTKPRYYPSREELPTTEEITQIIYDASKVSKLQVLSYDSVADQIRADSKVDIRVLPPKKAEEVFNAHMADYADAYLVVTVANNSRTAFFFNVYNVSDNALLYTYEIYSGRFNSDDISTYRGYAERFYRHFDEAAERQLKEASKPPKPEKPEKKSKKKDKDKGDQSE